jgi:hypothetical protein
MLHGEEMSLESAEGKEEEGKVVFCAFSGIAPRQYRQLFSMSERGAKKGKPLAEWVSGRRALVPRYVMLNAELGYLLAERKELEKLSQSVYLWDSKAVCPVTGRAAVESPLI